MNAKDLERFLAERGASASAVDQTVRALRKAFHLSVFGRGPNAADLSPPETSWVLASYAGSEVASRANETLQRLMTLFAPVGARLGRRFDEAFMRLITANWEEALEVRICRDHPYAVIRYVDGREELFGDLPPKSVIRVECVIPGALIDELRQALRLSGSYDRSSEG